MRKLLILLSLVVVSLVSACSSTAGRSSFSMDAKSYEMYHGSDRSE